MLVLKRKLGQWVEVTHKSGDILRICLWTISKKDQSKRGPTIELVFEDVPRNFAIAREETKTV